MKRYFLLSMLLTPMLSRAQSNYQKGYVVTNDKDTINGFIDYKENANNPKSVSFKTASKGDAVSYNRQNASAINIAGVESYERFLVNISQSNARIEKLSYGQDTTSIRDSVFLKVIQKGKNVNFYAYTDDNKTRFYLLDKDASEPEELIINTYYLNESGKTRINERYKRQLIAFMLKYNLYQQADSRRIINLRYSKTPLLEEISRINGQELVKEKASFRFFAGAGLSINKLSYAGESQFNRPVTTQKTSYTPMLTAGIDLLANPNIGRMIYRLELSFLMAKGDIKTTAVDRVYAYQQHTFDSYGLTLFPQALYNFYNTPALKVYGGVGLGINLVSYKNNQIATKVIRTDMLRIEEDGVELERLNFAPALNAGIVIKKKVELFGNYHFTSPISNYTIFNACIQRTNIGIKYLFAN